MTSCSIGGGRQHRLIEIVSDDCFGHVFQFLSLSDVTLNCNLVCHRWLQIINNSQLLWDALCVHTWQDKVYVPVQFENIRKQGQPRRALMLSVQDSSRFSIAPSELCVLNWDCRFIKALWLEKVVWRISFDLEGDATCWNVRQSDRNPESALKMPWNYSDIPGSKMHSWIRVGDFRHHEVRRHPKNWGFILQGCFVIFTSWPISAPGEDPYLEESTEAFETPITSSNR
eukprot:TRINITY_DN34033_c0_g1_i1.p1 TRINITY_DN34033_c0_g1~~TRINITY_DN34033_c0_g1_i1.p1  ORF type:complete len:228 (+),score=48.15 TRINITY_DN34033_c0_g1_i1:70-753(+)